MITVSELYKALNEMIPAALSCEWDNDGLMVCPDPGAIAGKVLIALDATDAAIAHAERIGAQVILTHHPLIFKPLRSVTSPGIIRLIKGGLSVMSFHTRLDSLDGGVNSALAAALGITGTEKLCDEIGLIGTPHECASVNEYARFVCKSLGCDSVRYIPSERSVHRVAVVGGSGKDYIDEALAKGADVFVTGESGYHAINDAFDAGMSVIDAGHYETEYPVCSVLKKFVHTVSPETETEINAYGRIKNIF